MDLSTACRLFKSVVDSFLERDYFQEWFGYECVDAGFVSGLAGSDTTAFALRKTRVDGIWPVGLDVIDWDELHLMTAIEFAYDFVSKPAEGSYHGWSDCGWHYTSFDKSAGQAEYLSEVNQLIADLGEGFELRVDGDVVRLSPRGLATLVDAPIPSSADALIKTTVEDAIQKFRSRAGTAGDRRDAVRDLAGVLEHLRPQLKRVLEKPDEADLFNIANNFALRHENTGQKRNYDPTVWHSWMFYFYLATIHAALRFIEKSKATAVDASTTGRPSRPRPG